MSDVRSNRYWRNREPKERVVNTEIPKRFRSDTLDTFKVFDADKESINAIKGWVDSVEKQVDDGFGLYIVGSTGSGKTHLAQAVLKRVVFEHKLCGIFITADNYLQLAYNEIKFDGDVPDGYEDPTAKMTSIKTIYDIVVLDSLGFERTTDFAQKTISSLIETRYHQQLPMIITSSLRPEQLSNMYGSSIGSIISDCCYLVPLKSRDYRTSKWLDGNAGQ